jgi:hypothetical protein
MTTRRNLRLFLGLGAALALAACGHDDAPTGPPHYTEPVTLVGGYAAAFNARNAAVCTDLLEAPSSGVAGFRFFPKSEDLPGFDWLAGQSWGYEREGGMLSNMLDPTYVSEAAAVAGYTGVGGLNLRVESATALAGNEVDVVVSGRFALKRVGRVDLPFDVSLRFVLATRADGTLVIREMHELSSAMDRSSVGLSWATVQGWYRDPPPQYSDPNALVAAHAAALGNRDLEAYTSLLDDAFAYFPQTADLQDLVWMTGDSWGRADETTMIRHIFDPDFQPTVPYVGSVDSIHASIQVVTVEPAPTGGGYIVTTHAVIMVLYDATSGARADILLDFHLVPHDGHLLIGEIHELPLQLPVVSDLPAVEPTTWGEVKAMYR